jgi:hypothetical protein
MEYLQCLRACLILFILLGSNFRSFLLPEEKVKVTDLNREGIIRSHLALLTIREEDFLVREEKAITLDINSKVINSQVINSQERLLVTVKC